MKSEKYNSLEIEESLLGLIIVSKTSLEQAISELVPEDFVSTEHSIIMKSIFALFNERKAVSFASLSNILKKTDEFEIIGGKQKLDSLILSNVSRMHVSEYIKIIKENARIRKVDTALQEARKYIGSTTTTDVNELIHQIEADILVSTRTTETIEQRSIEKILTSVIEKIDSNKKNDGVVGLETGFSQLDNLTTGFHEGDFIILAARPSMGKTALALNLAINIGKAAPVYFFSLEMPSEQLAQRMISVVASIDGNKLRKPKYLSAADWNKIYKSKEELSKRAIIIDETPGIKLTDILWKCRKMVKEQGVKAIIVDYLQLISHENRNGNRQEEVSVISRSLKELARELKVPIIALSQLSRKVEQREDKRPLMSDLRESGSIEQDADLIMFLFREDYYKKESSETLQDVDVIISKHRNGPTGNVELMFELNTGIFKDK